MMKTLMLAVIGLTLVSSPAFAKGKKHCVKDSKEISVAGKGKARAAACTAAGGKWVKVNPATAK